jgi:plastocyanin
MFLTRFLFSSCVATSLVLAVPATAQTAARVTFMASHLIVVKLVERPGDKVRFAFEPATFTAKRGDTLQFVQFANAMHNVRFKTQPSGAKLGRAVVSRYLSTMGQTYNIVVDSRFADGTYEIVCDPHGMMGMHAFLTVQGATNAITSTQK